MKENKLYDNCALFHPENGGQSSERALPILFAPDGFEQETGFLILFSQKGIVQLYMSANSSIGNIRDIFFIIYLFFRSHTIHLILAT